MYIYSQKNIMVNEREKPNFFLPLQYHTRCLTSLPPLILTFLFLVFHRFSFSLHASQLYMRYTGITLLGTSSVHCFLFSPSLYPALHLWSTQLFSLSFLFGVVSISKGDHNIVRFIKILELKALEESTVSLKNRFCSLSTVKMS